MIAKVKTSQTTNTTNTKNKKPKLATVKTANTPASRPMNADKRERFFAKLSEHIKEPATELNY